MVKALLSTGLIALATVTAPLHADPVTAPRIEVKTADLNLLSVQGQAILDRRLASAVSDVCGAGDSRDLASQAQTHACREQARMRIAPRRAAIIAAATPMRDHATLAAR